MLKALTTLNVVVLVSFIAMGSAVTAPENAWVEKAQLLLRTQLGSNSDIQTQAVD